MKSLLPLLAALGMAFLQGCTPPQVIADPAARAAEIARLTQQADAWDRAIVVKDAVAIAANMAEDFRQIDADGDLETKASFVAGLLDPALRIDPYAVEDFEVRLYGDVALLSGRTRMTGAHQGKPFASHYRYIDVYVRRAGAWKIVSVQITRLPP
ncbi:MAG: nuclear transport factor 2 family protein [Burkholderiales bacterium]|nr:nuclear transport factor 2 family protein [Burkholderiales bacterium]